jgi:hypothetical protein
MDYRSTGPYKPGCHKNRGADHHEPGEFAMLSPEYVLYLSQNIDRLMSMSRQK